MDDLEERQATRRRCNLQSELEPAELDEEDLDEEGNYEGEMSDGEDPWQAATRRNLEDRAEIIREEYEPELAPLRKSKWNIEWDLQRYYKGLSEDHTNDEPPNFSKISSLPCFTKSDFTGPTATDEAVQMSYRRSNLKLACTKIHSFLYETRFGTSRRPHEHIRKFEINIDRITKKDPSNWYKVRKYCLEALTTLAQDSKKPAQGLEKPAQDLKKFTNDLEVVVRVDCGFVGDGQPRAVLDALKPHFERLQALPTTHVEVLGVYLFVYTPYASQEVKERIREMESLDSYYGCKGWEDWLQQKKKELLESLPLLSRYGDEDNSKADNIKA
ncbi:hypothetical protein E8E11_003900 [Didymella keratinophila]|nr:hypothetical protein E8E11_003900 [Didymella keratinophila]